MSEIERLEVTLELPASEFLDHDSGNLLVRCPLNGVWVPLTDYYSEQQGSLLPLVGNVSYEEAAEEWFDIGLPNLQVPPNKDGTPQPLMEKRKREGAVVWNETVRILAKVEEAPPEGGTLEFSVHEKIASQDIFGG